MAAILFEPQCGIATMETWDRADLGDMADILMMAGLPARIQPVHSSQHWGEYECKIFIASCSDTVL